MSILARLNKIEREAVDQARADWDAMFRWLVAWAKAHVDALTLEQLRNNCCPRHDEIIRQMFTDMPRDMDERAARAYLILKASKT